MGIGHSGAMSEILVNFTKDGAYELLLLELSLAVLLVVGGVLVRLRHVRLHRALQSTIVLVNIPIVLVLMVPPYLAYVAPGLPADLTQSFYLYPTLMLIAGAVAEALGIFIILVAGTNWIPSRFRFRRYKLWMRTELGLWWVVLLAGIATYYYWWVAP
jgi:type IV secretory pathway VirB2 component (pilin)